jgi:hypothetical protein
MGNFDMIARWLMIGGIVLLVAGGIFWLFSKVFGSTNLPGTLRFEFSGVTCIFPILASIVISIVLTIVLNVVARLFNK